MERRNLKKIHILLKIFHKLILIKIIKEKLNQETMMTTMMINQEEVQGNNVNNNDLFI